MISPILGTQCRMPNIGESIQNHLSNIGMTIRNYCQENQGVTNSSIYQASFCHHKVCAGQFLNQNQIHANAMPQHHRNGKPIQILLMGNTESLNMRRYQHTKKQKNQREKKKCHVSCVKCPVSLVICHMSCVPCHVSHVMCHSSPVTCQLLPVTCQQSPGHHSMQFQLV